MRSLKLIFASIMLMSLAFSASAQSDWTDWENYCTGTYDAQWWYRKPMKDLPVMRRHSAATPTRVQYKVCGLFGDGQPAIDLIINANFAVEGPKAGDYAIWIDEQYIESFDVYGASTSIYLSDAATYYEDYFPLNPEYALEYEDASYFRSETGTFHIYAYYHYDNGNVPFLDANYTDQAQGMETLKLHAPEFKDYDIDFANGKFVDIDGEPHYSVDVTFADLSQVKMTVARGVTDVATYAKAIVAGDVESLTVTEPGTVVLPFDGVKGDYMLVYATYKADGTPYQFGSTSLSYDPDWLSLGNAVFTDGFICNFLKGDLEGNLHVFLTDDDCSWPVEIQESIVTPGKYRLVNPYGSASPYWDLDFSQVKLNHKETFCIYIDATDPLHVTIEPSATGFFYGSTPLEILSEGFDWLSEDYSVDQIPEYAWGKKLGNVITFMATADDSSSLMARLGAGTASITGRALSVVLPEAGVEAVEAEAAAAPAEYYNLQGIRVAAPQSGHIYIVRQGASVSKRIVR